MNGTIQRKERSMYAIPGREDRNSEEHVAKEKSISGECKKETMFDENGTRHVE